MRVWPYLILQRMLSHRVTALTGCSAQQGTCVAVDCSNCARRRHPTASRHSIRSRRDRRRLAESKHKHLSADVKRQRSLMHR